MSDEGFFSKKGQRKVGAFFGQELLYDYMTGQLDEERKKAVEEYLEINRDAQVDIQKIQNGLSYVEKLSETKVSEALTEKIKTPNSYLQGVLLKVRFDEWPPAVKLGIEASVVSVGITILALIVPWHKLMDLKFGSSEIVLTEVSKQYARPGGEASENIKETAQADSKKDEVSFPDEGRAGKAVATNSTTTTSTTLKQVNAPIVAVVEPTTTTVPKAETESTEAPVAAADGKKAGFLYRGSMAITNVKAVTPKLVERIEALGGRRAGDVELGWNKGAGAYFHFTMPESRYDELLAAFKEYGQLKISREHHERVMPEGIIRLIITVDEKK